MRPGISYVSSVPFPFSHVRSNAPLRDRFRGFFGALAIAALVGAGVSAGGVWAAAPAEAATAQSCGFATAGTGTYAQTICWFDLSGFNAAQSASAGGQAMSQSLPGGYTLSYTMTTTGGPIRSTVLPTYSGAFLGNNGHYTGIPGQPALYQTASGTTTTATLTNIVARDSAGRTVTGYALVGADAESTDGTESLAWTSSSPLRSLTQTPTGNGLGNACAGGFTGAGTTRVTCTGSGGGSKSGTAILASADPSTFIQSMHGQGLQAFAFGVLVSRVQLNKQVTNGFPGDSFQVSVADSSGSVLGTANTGGGSTASTGPITVLAGETSQNYLLSETATAGSLTNYDATWACTRNGTADPTLPSGPAGTSASVALGVGDFSNCTITNTAKVAALTLVKHAGTPVDVNGDGLVDAGDSIAYTFTVTNTGALPLTPVTVTDSKIGAVTCPSPGLAIGASETCAATAPYAITSADMAAGSVNNTATAAGTPAGRSDPTVSAASSTSTPVVAPAPGISVAKTVNPVTVTAAGDAVTYSLAVTNTGNVPLNGITVTDQGFTGTGTPPRIFCPTASLAPAGTERCVGSYIATQSDIDTGTVSNTATASGIPTGFTTTPVKSAPSTTAFTATADPALTLVKSADPSTAPEFRAGQHVKYSFVLTNTGNVTLTDTRVIEGTFTGTGPAPVVSCPDTATSLAPSRQVTCTATYVLTQSDIDAGTVSNGATATGTAPSGTSVAAPESIVTIPATEHSSLSLQKTSDPSIVHVPGQVIQYRFDVTNTGNTTLSNVSVTEGAFTGAGNVSAIECPNGSVLPGQTISCTARYTVQAADLLRDTLVNSATATATGPVGAPVTSPNSTVSIPVAPAALTLQKTATPNTVTAPGQIIHYAFRVTNTGQVGLVGVGIVEGSFTGTGATPVVSCPATVLAVGATETCTGSYAPTTRDLASARITNTATATGTLLGFADPITSDPSTTSTTIAQPAVPPTPPVTTPPSSGNAPAGRTAAGPSPLTLAFTGSAPALPALAGFLLLLSGVLLANRGRRQKRPQRK